MHFINTKPIKLSLNNKLIELPAFLEIVKKGENSYTIIPLESFEYFGISLKGDLDLSENGVLSGDCEKEYDVEIFGFDNVKQIKIRNIEIAHDGKMQIKLFNEKTYKVEKYDVKLIK